MHPRGDFLAGFKKSVNSTKLDLTINAQVLSCRLFDNYTVKLEKYDFQNEQKTYPATSFFFFLK